MKTTVSYTGTDLHSTFVTVPAYSSVYHRHGDSSGGKFRAALWENRKCCHQRLPEETEREGEISGEVEGGGGRRGGWTEQEKKIANDRGESVRERRPEKGQRRGGEDDRYESRKRKVGWELEIEGRRKLTAVAGCWITASPRHTEGTITAENVSL